MNNINPKLFISTFLRREFSGQKIIYFFLISLILSVSPSSAETIDIFDHNRGEEKTNNVNPIQTRNSLPTKRKVLNRYNRPEFYLSGISRVGKRYRIYFTDKKRKTEKFIWVNDKKTSSNNVIYQHYIISKISDRKVYLNIKGNKKCVENQSHGISCDNATKQMIMGMCRMCSGPRKLDPMLGYKRKT